MFTHVTRFNARGTDLFICYPEGSRRETSGVLLNFTAPNFIVYGDQTSYTEEEAAAFLEELGFDAAAAEGGGLVLLVLGKGKRWAKADMAAYDNILGCMNPDTSAKYDFGVGVGRNFFTHEEETRIVGFPGAAHLVGVGKGADFVGQNMIRALPLERERKPGAMVSPDHSPASVLLINGAKAPVVDPSVIPGDPGYQVPLRVSALNCKDKVAAALVPLTSKLTPPVLHLDADLKRGLKAVLKSYNLQYLRQAEQLIPAPDWTDSGMVCWEECRTVPTAPNNPGVMTLTHDLHFNLYFPVSLDRNKDKVPLLLTFHGGGNTALFMCAASQWPQIAAEDKFMVVALDQHTSVPAEEIMALIVALKQEFPCIDEGKLYANGYSMGSVKCWELIEKYPHTFAGIAPMHGSFAASQSIPKFRTPVFYVGGELSPLPEFPYQNDNMKQRVEYVLKMNEVPVDYQPDYEVNRWWGINGDRTDEILDKNTYRFSVLTVEYFDSADGVCMTALSGGSNEGHEVYERNCRAAWDFLKKFRRMPDGSITVE